MTLRVGLSARRVNSSSIMAYGIRHTLVERHALNYIVKRNSLNKAIHHLLSKVIHRLLYKKYIHCRPANPSLVVGEMGHVLGKLETWMSSNRLRLNPTNTKFIWL